jgi:hypothetical protein
MPQPIKLQRNPSLNPMKHTPHKKPCTDVIIKHSQLIDIAMMPLEKADDSGNLSRGARAGQGQGELM